MGARAVPVSRLQASGILPRIGTVLQSTCSCPSTPSPRLIRSKVSTVDSGRAPARCSIRPVRRSKLKVAVCSRADASHGLLLRHTVCRRGKTPENTQRGFRSIRRPVEFPFAPVPSCTAQPRARGSKYYLNPSSWARAVPVSRLRLASCFVRPFPIGAAIDVLIEV